MRKRYGGTVTPRPSVHKDVAPLEFLRPEVEPGAVDFSQAVAREFLRGLRGFVGTLWVIQTQPLHDRVVKLACDPDPFHGWPEHSHAGHASPWATLSDFLVSSWLAHRCRRRLRPPAISRKADTPQETNKSRI